MQVDPRTVRRLRENKGMAQIDLANAAQITKQHLSAIETGQRNPSERVAARLAQALDVAIADLRGPLR